MSVCLSVYHTIKCGRIVTKLYTDISWYNTEIVKKYHRNGSNVSHQIFGKLIIVANSGTSWRFFDIMKNFLKSRWIVWRHDVFLTSWQTFWHHDVFWTSWQTFGVFLVPWIVFTWWRLFDKPFEVMTSILSSWRVFTSWRIFWRQGELSDVLTYLLTNFLTSWYVLDIMTSWKVLAWHTFGRHDVMNFLTSWCVLYVMIRFWCHWRHNIFFYFMTTFDFMTNFWRHDVSWWIFWSKDQLFVIITCFWHHDEWTFWRHDMFLTSWRPYWSHDFFLTS